MATRFISNLARLILILGLVGCGSIASGKDLPLIPRITESNSQSTIERGAYVVTVESGNTMTALWTVSGYVIGKDSTLSDQDAQALLFKPLDISETGITFGGQACKNVTFQQETVNASEYYSATWQTTVKTLGIEDQELQVFKTDCPLPGFQEYVRLGDSRLVVPMNGIFFFFEPTFSR
jgi:hypothetical protein